MSSSRDKRSRRRRFWTRRNRTIGLGALAAVLVFAVGLYAARLRGPSQDADQRAIVAVLDSPGMADLKAGYAAHGFKPIWVQDGRVRPEVLEVAKRVAASGADGLDPSLYGGGRLTEALKAETKSPAERALIDVQISRAYADFASDLRRPVAAAEMAFTDPGLPPQQPTPEMALQQLVEAPSLQSGVARATQMNPLYLQYRQALVGYRARPNADAATVRLLQANMERLRALPPQLGQRFVLVDAAGARLYLFENGQPTDSMKVVVGKPEEATPEMAGVIRYALFNPNWNVPPDLTQRVYAPRIRANLAALESLDMDVWSDYTATARKLDPKAVDWDAVAQGRQSVWLRQRPGPRNSMGAVKFMLPNTLGIYLHDTPNKGLFGSDQRTFSAGCVRVEDYKRLARWLYGGEVGPKGDAAEQRFDLKAPTPVYITYLTAASQNGEVVARKDVYGRDAQVIAQLQKGQREARNTGSTKAQELSPALRMTRM